MEVCKLGLYGEYGSYAIRKLICIPLITDLLTYLLTYQDEEKRLENDIISLLESEGNLYEHVWNEGEVIISDNLAVAHKASKNTQRYAT